MVVHARRSALRQNGHSHNLKAAAIGKCGLMRLPCRPVRRIGPQTQPMFIGKRPICLVREIEVQLDYILRCGACLVQNDLQIAKHKRRLFALIDRIVITFQPLAEDTGRDQ